ncbi:UNVERIFIED_ORG: hypothetical protein J2Y78_000618 [Buttiauxella agrestis ATCC 33320]
MTNSIESHAGGSCRQRPQGECLYAQGNPQRGQQGGGAGKA